VDQSLNRALISVRSLCFNSAHEILTWNVFFFQGDLSRYFGGDVDISSVMAHSVEWDEEPGKLTKMSINESLIKPENRIPRATHATW